MYQVPVRDVVKLRRSRKRVKSILCDIALQSCQDLIEKYKSFDAGEESFNNTEWEDFIDGNVGKKRKKWRYRPEALCCSLCWFSTRSFYTFRGHVQRCHEEELDLACLSTCPKCTFISHPEITEQHIKYFHTVPTKACPSAPSQSASLPSKAVTVTASVDLGEDRYTCVNCGYHDSLLYVMKKHVLVNHYATLLNRYFGHRLENGQNTDGQKNRDSVPTSRYYCKECKLPAETIEHLLYHILSSDKHKELHWHIMPFISEKNISNAGQQKFQSLAPKVAQQGKNVSMVQRPNVAQHPKAVKVNPPSKSNGAMLLTGPTNTTALLCSPGARQIFLSSQTPSLLPGTTVTTIQNTQQQPSTGIQALSTSPVVKSLNMVVPNMSQGTPKQVPVAMTVPRLPQAQPGQQMLLPPGVQVNLPGKIGVRPPMLLTHRLQLNQSAPRPPIIASQSVRLIPTGNKVNGVPTYTLAPVQVTTVPVQPNSGQVVNSAPVVLAQNGPQIGKPTVMGPPNTAVVPAKAASSSQKLTLSKNNKPNELAVLTPFLKKQNDHTVKCLRCKVLLTEQWIFQHLLHGLKCLFCPQMFYSFKQIMEHTKKDHSLKIKRNRDFIKEQYKLNCDEEGNLIFAAFNLNTDVPKDLLDNRELNLVLVTSTQDKIYIKMYPDSAKAVYPPSLKTTPTVCPFCQVKLQNSEDYELHLKGTHHIVPTIHAILKSPAFKCIYCFGVYSEKSTPKTISIHVQRCRCAPRNVKEAERLLNPDPNAHLNGDFQNSVQQIENPQQQNILKTELANMEKKETAKSKKEVATEKGTNGNVKVSKVDFPAPTVELVLDPTGMEMRSFEERKEFLTKYFHRKPYPSKAEALSLAARLWLNKTDILSHFGTKRSRCMKAIQKRRTVVLLGFNMTEVNKVNHNLLVPEVEPAN
ncbi:activity-dependent neuroprotector homeobox protein 2a [Electrophorus electricus]|uniref:C2H2-type domain-containing protein n=1 Tax=Electrophorus electricus TaxID=8005 RepID=A0A4W4G8E4_ELEEL|nr:activity-dependent neuroprotector homeobox protein 2a [Electrophorus electricus]XP_026863111.2 activity-dependent neuroprotector homeobox protein 2a [Electrophorus electricus]